MNKIRQLIEVAGGVSALAAELGVKPPTVSQWRNGTRPVPPRLALAIAVKWPAIATVYDLRPDVFGPAPDTREVAA